MLKALKHPHDAGNCMRVDVVEECIKENAKFYKERTKKGHDPHILNREFTLDRRFKVNRKRLKAYMDGGEPQQKATIALSDPT